MTGLFADAIAHVNKLLIPVLAIDIPSGLNADTGNIMGCAICADITITFIVLKKRFVYRVSGRLLWYCDFF